MIILRQKNTQLDSGRYKPTKEPKGLFLTPKIPNISYEFFKKTTKNGDDWNYAMHISLVDSPEKGHFELVKDREDKNYSCHFRTMSSKGYKTRYDASEPLKDEEKNLLFKALILSIPIGCCISSWSGITKGGIHGVESLGKRSEGRLIEFSKREVTTVDGEITNITIWKRIK